MATQRYFKNTQNYKIYNEINQIKHEYGIFSQIMMALFYLHYISKYKILDKNEFTRYYELLIYNIERSYYDDQTKQLNKSKEHINDIKNNTLEQDNEQIYTHISTLNDNILNWLNHEFKQYAYKYIELMRDKPRFYKLMYD